MAGSADSDDNREDEASRAPESGSSAASPLPGLRAKEAPPSDEGTDGSSPSAEPEESRRAARRHNDDAAPIVNEDGVDPAARAEIEHRRDEALLINHGLAAAISSADLAIAVVERSTGLVRWASTSWLERFGEKDTIARHMPTSTEFGESPLPPPGESWQRTRSLLFADGSEQLADLLLTGSTAPDGTDIVSVVARDKGSAVMVTERGAVISVIENAIEHAPDATVAALYVDLDRFKVVHDLVGNLEALRILDLVNHRIAATVRGADLLFRLHSDEFVIVASELEHPESAEALAERVRAAVATLTELGHDLAITASVGVALSGEGQTGDELLSAAETAVYVAKGRGRNRVAVHDEELRTRTQRLMVVERQLRQAIDRKDVRFAYQPVVEIATGRVTGAEALLRLGGEVGLSAVEVVAAAEHSGLMGALGVLVLGGVDEQLGSFLRNDGTEVIMVNLSATQLADEGLVRALESLTTDRSLPPGRIAVEVPELVVRDHRKAVMRLAETVRPALRLGVDGFGTGLLDDGAVASLPIDYVKLHRSVTTSLLTAEPAEVARMRALVERVGERGITVIALGVEDNEQAEALAAIGCTAAQGFLYAGAVTADSLLDLVATGIDVAQPHGSS